MEKHHNTGVFKEYTKETQDTNMQLMKLYSAWYEHMKSMESNIKYKHEYIKSKHQYNGLHLLTCFDPYKKSNNKIMIFGKEANTDEGQIEKFDPNYQKDEYYNYEYLIVNPDKAVGEERKQIRNTFFLTARKKLSGISDGEKPSYEKLFSVVVNNLNKASFNGGFTPCNYDFESPNNTDNAKKKIVDNIVYQKFEFAGVRNNIYIHELNILRPTHIVFFCGKRYNKHIKRDFGQDFFNENKEAINRLSITDNPTSKIFFLDRQRICRLFGLEDYEALKIIFALHPNARMTERIRRLYDESLLQFIET